MVQLTKQDVQNCVDNAKNRIVERMISRQEVQTVTDAARDRIMTYFHDLVQIHQQQLFRRSNMQFSQMQRQIVALESRLLSMDQEMKAMRQVMERLANQEPQRIVMPTQPEQQTKPEPYTQYVYRTA
jgi:Mg2+ and Co2+ transporter CorA